MSANDHNEQFHRISRLPPYVFEEVNKLKLQLRRSGADIIDFGMGNPDLSPPKHIVDKLCEAVVKPDVHGYSSSRGIPGLRRACAAYYQRRFGVELNPETEVVATLGSKEGFANLAQAITAPGDLVLVPEPSYPIHAYGFVIAGAALRQIPAHDPESYLRGLHEAVTSSTPSPTAAVVCYPSNPTAQTASLDFYREVVALAKRYDLMILSDLAYAELYFDERPPSIFEVDGAKDVAVETISLSKMYSMAGWRVGFAVGNQRMIGALTRVKSYLDYGAFTPIQVAACAALNGPQDYLDEMRATYRRRRDALVESFGDAGWQIPPPAATMFCWAPLPEKMAHLGSLEFARRLMVESHVAVSPGVGFGPAGEGYVRLALVENRQRIRQAARNLKEFLRNSGAKAAE